MQNGVRYTATVSALNSYGYSLASPVWPKLPGMPVVAPPVPAAAAAVPAPEVRQDVTATPATPAVTTSQPAAAVTTPLTLTVTATETSGAYQAISAAR